jgi:hypothetical protein
MFTLRDRMQDVPVIVFIGPALVVPVLAVILTGAVALGRHIARSEEAFLVDWLKRTLDAH